MTVRVGEELVVVDLLEEVAADLGQRYLPAQRKNGDARLLGVVETVEEVDRPWADGAHADTERPGQVRLRAGRERAGLLVPDADPLQPVLAPDGVGHRVQRVSHDSPYVPDSEVGKTVDDQLSDGGHGALLLRCCGP